MLYKTLPSMCAMMAALSILRKSGAMEAFTGAVSPALQKAGMPGELPGRSHSRGCIRPCARPHGGCIIYQLCKGSL